MFVLSYLEPFFRCHCGLCHLCAKRPLCTKRKFCLINLITLYDEVSGLVDERQAVHVIYLEFRKAFDTVCHKILKDKLLMYGLDKHSEVD